MRLGVKYSGEIRRFFLMPAFLGTGLNKSKASSEIHGIAEPTKIKKRHFRAGFQEHYTE